MHLFVLRIEEVLKRYLKCTEERPLENEVKARLVGWEKNVLVSKQCWSISCCRSTSKICEICVQNVA